MFKFFRKKQPPQPKIEEAPAAPVTDVSAGAPAPDAVPDVPAADVWNRSAQRQQPVPPAELPPEQPTRPAPAATEAAPTPGAGLVPPAERVAPPTAADLPPAVAAPEAPAFPTAPAPAAVPAPPAPVTSKSPVPAPPPAADPAIPAAPATSTAGAAPPSTPTPAAATAVPAAPAISVEPAAPPQPSAPAARQPAPLPSAPSAPAMGTAEPAQGPKIGGAPVDRPGQAAKQRLQASPAAAAAAAPDAGAKTSWLARLKSGLSRTGQNITGLFVNVKVDEDLFEELETALIMADAGVEATTSLLNALRARVRKERIEDGARVKDVLRELLTGHLEPLERPFDLAQASPLVVMIAGVNGAGKTTSIGKLARTFQQQGASVLLAAGDTFRAAAREQLVEWGARNNVAVIAQGDGSDPAAVAFDAVQAGRARGLGVVMVDTAGRLPTQLHLMAELKKIRRVINKADDAAPHEVLLVVDGNTGQNALAQIKAFDEALGLTGLVVTKLDGTAKGGILAAVASGSQGVRPVPVYWIGVGEGIDDLQPFVASEFAGALLGS